MIVPEIEAYNLSVQMKQVLIRYCGLSRWLPILSPRKVVELRTFEFMFVATKASVIGRLFVKKEKIWYCMR